MAVTHSHSLEDQTTVSLQVEEEQRLQRSPHSATQVVRRTSVLCELTRMLLSEGRMSGMWPLGQQAGGPMARIVPPSVWQARLPGPPLTFTVLSWRSPEGVSTSRVMISPSGSASRRDHPGPNISVLTWSGEEFHILVCNNILREFCDITLTSTARNVSSLIFPTLPSAQLTFTACY